MVGVDTHLVLLGVEGELTQVDGAQLVVGLQVWPTPQAAVDDMGQPLPVGHLQTTIQRPGGVEGGGEEMERERGGWGRERERDRETETEGGWKRGERA